MKETFSRVLLWEHVAVRHHQHSAFTWRSRVRQVRAADEQRRLPYLLRVHAERSERE
jgi:hypothetical protein